MTAKEALEKLKAGNLSYLKAERGSGNISPELRKNLFSKGQTPYAAVVACSDSRVVPECIFSAGLGELFVIRVAGNVIENHQLGSIEYAVAHLNCKFVLVLGHDNCGAVGAALKGGAEGYIKSLTDEIRLAIGEEKDALKASCLNVRRAVKTIADKLDLKRYGAEVAGAVYRLEDGRVEFLPAEEKN